METCWDEVCACARTHTHRGGRFQLQLHEEMRGNKKLTMAARHTCEWIKWAAWIRTCADYLLPPEVFACALICYFPFGIKLRLINNQLHSHLEVFFSFFLLYKAATDVKESWACSFSFLSCFGSPATLKQAKGRSSSNTGTGCLNAS